ncbi:MAG TPA: polysaccharide biosynthesis protein [Terracidiphilus sp.]|jgi:FlaA1/EpsC-like NDP-sugar epimerase
MRSVKPADQILDVALEDLLGRRQAYLDEELVRERIQDKVVMVTGAAGSIGSELCRQIAGFNPFALVAFDQAEALLRQLESELAERFPRLVLHSEIGNIICFDHVNRAVQQYKPTIVFHAAASKHVPMLEQEPLTAVENNIFGTWQVAEAAARHGIEYFVMISTDKAVRPVSMMGVTKRVAELVLHAFEKEWSTKFLAVRFGNVLGSSGSVVPIFKSQIAAGGPVTVTHPEMRRYFMTASEAGQLVLEALVLGSGGETFVLDMGEPVKILDLAKQLILLSGLQPGRDIEIEFTGVRPGEKLFEELSLHDEQLTPTSHSRISSLASSENVDTERVAVLVKELREAVNARDALRVILLLKDAVPDYAPGPQLLENAISMRSNHDIALDVQVRCG